MHVNWICASLVIAVPTTVLVIGACTYSYMLTIECIAMSCKQLSGCAIDACKTADYVVVSTKDACDAGCEDRKDYARSGSIMLLCIGSVLLAICVAVVYLACRDKTKITPTKRSDIERGECTICLEPIVSDGHQTACRHWFHEKCLERWLYVKRTCPNCCSTV